jgi:hypothetical protein
MAAEPRIARLLYYKFFRIPVVCILLQPWLSPKVRESLQEREIYHMLPFLITKLRQLSVDLNAY